MLIMQWDGEHDNVARMGPSRNHWFSAACQWGGRAGPAETGLSQATCDQVTHILSLWLLSFSEEKTLLTERQKLSFLTLHEGVGGEKFILTFYRVETVPVMKWFFDLVLMGFFCLAGRSKQMHMILVISLGKNRYLLCHSHLRRGRGRWVGLGWRHVH